jgi:hypothetical protein
MTLFLAPSPGEKARRDRLPAVTGPVWDPVRFARTMLVLISVVVLGLAVWALIARSGGAA